MILHAHLPLQASCLYLRVCGCVYMPLLLTYIIYETHFSLSIYCKMVCTETFLFFSISNKKEYSLSAVNSQLSVQYVVKLLGANV